nr:bifunctional dethiobiotin synthetase/7,8-diamino-pelargonic acid aminotransferase, mitochondrial [Ipomoea trifida]
MFSRFAKGKAVSRRKIGDFGVNEVFNKFGDFDNGSTTLKMALHKFLFDHKVLLENSNGNGAGRYIDLKVLALRGSYHGDTLGAMEAQAPSSYTGFYQQPRYQDHTENT